MSYYIVLEIYLNISSFNYQLIKVNVLKDLFTVLKRIERTARLLVSGRSHEPETSGGCWALQASLAHSTHLGLDLGGALALHRGQPSTGRAAQGLECHSRCSRLQAGASHKCKPEQNQQNPTTTSAPHRGWPWL